MRRGHRRTRRPAYDQSSSRPRPHVRPQTPDHGHDAATPPADQTDNPADIPTRTPPDSCQRPTGHGRHICRSPRTYPCGRQPDIPLCTPRARPEPEEKQVTGDGGRRGGCVPPGDRDPVPAVARRRAPARSRVETRAWQQHDPPPEFGRHTSRRVARRPPRSRARRHRPPPGLRRRPASRSAAAAARCGRGCRRTRSDRAARAAAPPPTPRPVPGPPPAPVTRSVPPVPPPGRRTSGGSDSLPCHSLFPSPQTSAYVCSTGQGAASVARLAEHAVPADSGPSPFLPIPGGRSSGIPLLRRRGPWSLEASRG